PRSGLLAAGSVGAALALAGTGEGGEGFGPSIAVAALLGGAGVALAGALMAAGRPRAGVRLGAVAAGALAIAFRVALGGAPAGPVILPEGAGPWPATVVTVSAPLDGSQRFVVALDDPAGLRVAVTAPRYPPVVPGDRVQLAGVLAAPPDSGYGAFLARSGIAGTLRSRELALLPAEPGPGRALETARRAVDAALALAMPEPAAGLASGILVGLRERVDRELAADFTATGLSHVLAISGWNIALVGGLAAALLARRPARVRLAVTLAVIVGYTLFAGASASVVRAAVMAGVALVARAGGRPGTAAAALGLAVAGIVLFAPANALDPGFQLSAAATAGLLAWAEPLGGRIRAAAPRLPAWVVEGLGVSLAAQAATLPIVLLEFGRLAPLAPVLNLAVVPLVPAAMATGVAAAAGGMLAAVGLPATVAIMAGLPATVVLGALGAIVGLGAGLPLAGLTLEPPLDAAAAGVAVGALLSVALRGRVRAAVVRRMPRTSVQRRPTARPAAIPAQGSGSPDPVRGRSKSARPGTRSPGRPARAARLALAAAGLAAGLVVIAASTCPDGHVHVVVLDVGQGDAILVETGGGGRVLVDGGPDPDRLIVALDRRLPPWDRRLDLVVLTHPHEDHVAGLPLVLERYSVGRVLATGARGTGPGFTAWETMLEQRNVATGRLLAGGSFAVDGVQFRALWPDPSAVPAEPTDDGSLLNDSSIVLLGETGGRRFLLAADMEAAAEALLVARGLPRVDLLKVGHHGSTTSSTPAFLDAIRPRLAVISVAARNDHGHPSPATLDALGARGVTVYRTDRQGTIDVVVDPDQVVVRAERSATTGRSTPADRPRVSPAASRLAGPGPGPVDLGGRRQVPGQSGVARARARAGRRSRLAYHRQHVRAGPRRGGRAPPLAPATALAPPPCPGGGRGRVLARTRGSGPVG
ncbi:MAG: ComEC/Rec2 family competence protein, partial [Chloroflexi bacterium]|nr:ComEC/Rec2 family competence protein [Chloroflexota bacterium]